MLTAHYGKKILAILLVGLIGFAGIVQATPRNVIIFIGDGLGLEQVKAGGIYVYGAAGSLSFESFPYQGQLTTYQYGGGITDSAAAATAIATGYKVNGGVVSMAYPGYPPDYPQGSELLTLLEYFKAYGKSTGLVSTTYITDATPAGFGAHEPSRNNYSQIAGDYLNQTQPNVLFGGGANGMTTSEFAAAGYTVVENRAAMLALNTESVTKVSGQFGSTDLPYEYDGLGNLPHLSEMTTTALNILDNDPDGFFLMVEGGRIDDACHSNDLVRTIPEVNELADSVQTAIDWAAGRSDTLIIVAADHETGGLTVLSNNGAGNYPDVSWGGTGHTAANIPVYAWGVNAGFVSGVLDNTDIFGIVTADTVILNSPSDESVLRDTQVSFNCSVTSDYNLIDATLYLGQVSGAPNMVTFSGSAATDDAQISADNPNTNYGSAVSINVDGATPHAHAVIKFPNIFGSGAGQVPSGSIITSATLKVNCTNVGNIMKLYRLTEDWVESQVTWNNRSSGISWTGAGAQNGSNAGVALNGDCTVLGWRTIDITQFVQEWSNGSPNYGIVIMDSGSDGVDFASSESANPPLLTVTYQGMQAKETKNLSGTSASVTFSTLTLNDQTDYVWNCLVRSTNGQKTRQTWAPFDSQFRVDSQIPEQPVLVAPADGAAGISTSPTLQVTASDPQGGLLDVTFYGRTVPPPDEYFTIVVLPDTQLYSKSYPAIFTAQTQWIVNNITGKNIVFVTQEGDLVDIYNSTTEWTNANTSMSLLDGAVPYGVLAGNHDKLTTQGAPGDYPNWPADSTYYNQYFPYIRYTTQSWYGGHYPDTGNNNNYQLFSAGGDNYVILHLEDTPGTNVITWANSVMTANSSRNAIITTHSYLDGSGNYNGKWGSTQYIRDMVVANSNVYFVLCGHLGTELTKTTTVGTRQVYELMADYQSDPNGGNGWLRIMRFVPAENKVYVKTYSPWLGQYQTDGNSRFTLDFPMNEFRVIGTATGVSSGQDASIVWSGLSVGNQYEWFAEVTDSTAKTRVGPVWSFTASTTDVTPPIISEVASSDITQTDATITWTTNEASNSVVRYGTTKPPTSQASDAAMVTGHSVTLTGLAVGTTYSYEVKSTDAAGNTATDNNSGVYYTLTTQADTTLPVITAATGNASGTTGEPVTISATITDNVGVASATVYYTPIGGSEATISITKGVSDIWSVQVPVASDKVGTIPYHITAKDAAGNTATDPASGVYNIAVTDNDAPSKITDLTATAVVGGNINLAWSAATDNIGVVSYNVYRDIAAITSPDPAKRIATGVTGNSYSDSPSADGTYFYAVTGLDAASNEGAVSNSPSVTLDVTPPTISAVASSNVTDSSATVTWTTDELSDSVVRYGINKPPASSSSEAAIVTGHSIAITGLSAGTTYYYEVQSKDAAGNTTINNDGGAYYSFTTTAPDTQPPAITGATGNTFGTTGEPVTISATIIDNVSVTSATVHYTPIDGSETTAPMTQGGGNIWSAGVPVASNKVGTITYYITAQDAVPIPNIARDPSSGTYSITVTDNDAPSRIIDLTATAVAGGNINLTWSAATDNIGVVSYNVYRDLAAITSPDPAKRIATGITATSYTNTPGADGTYYYAVTGIDSAGNEAQVSNSPSAIIDTTPPAISAVTSTNVTDSSATITWTTNEASNSTVNYGTATPPTSQASDATMVTNHSVTITGLSAATTYYYQVKSKDAAGNTATDNKGGTYYTFTTLTPAPKVLFSDGFESGNLTAGGWTISSASVKNTGAYSGTYCAQIKKTGWIRKAVSTAGYKNIHIKYARKTLNLDSGENENLYVEWSTNGSQWSSLESTRETTWAYKDLVCGTGADNKSGFIVRFRTNANRTDEYGYVDGVVVTGTPLSP
jgi:alkaline phosphatase